MTNDENTCVPVFNLEGDKAGNETNLHHNGVKSVREEMWGL